MLRHDLRVALEAADAADAVTLPRFQTADLEVEAKPDTTPVTEADRAAELAIREVLETRRPTDAITGEEFGTVGRAERRWILDPIDATVNFVRGLPVWATLIALEDGDGIAIGVVSAPAIGHRWWAGRGLGAYRNSHPMRVSKTSRISAAHLSFNSMQDAAAHGLGEGMAALTTRCARVRGFGDFLSFMFLADGAVDIVVEPVAKEWDLAPLEVIVTEAGGRFSDITGNLTVRGGNALATNGSLHEPVLEILGG